MRTTVTLDPDVEKLLRRAVRERGQSFKKVLNSAIRHGLTHKPKPVRFRQKTFRMGPAAPGVNLTKALQSLRSWRTRRSFANSSWVNETRRCKCAPPRSQRRCKRTRLREKMDRSGVLGYGANRIRVDPLLAFIRVSIDAVC